MRCGDERHRDHGLPCFHCHPGGYIRMVQHLIERCLVLRMSRDDTVHALARRAGIRPLITLTVWKELLKENRSFFHEYFREISFRPSVYKAHPRIPSFSRRKQWRCTVDDLSTIEEVSAMSSLARAAPPF